MKCADYRELLSGHVDGELMAAESQNVRDHVAECAECACELEMLERTSTLLRQRLSQGTHPKRARAAGCLRSAGATCAFALGATRGGGCRHRGSE